MIRHFGIATLVLACIWMGGASFSIKGQPSSQRAPKTSPAPPLLGVVWAPPDAPGPALRQLSKMHRSGVQALRLSSIPKTDAVFAQADTLGLQLFVDLPVRYVSAAALSDSLNEAHPSLSRLQQLAQRHASLQFVGLAHSTNTTTPDACDTLREWTKKIHAASRLRTYYVTPFSAASDRCEESVDATLLDTRGTRTPLHHWRSWSNNPPPLGIGALGTWVDPGSASGLRVPHSAERQARHLEEALHSFIDSASTPSYVFTYRWEDRGTPLLDTRRYGLRAQTNTPRPAADVMKGFYTRSQRVFAFPSGESPTATPDTFVLLGWMLLGLLGALYARDPYARETAFRYFAAHGFYRDALQEGRDIQSAVNLLLLLAVVLSVGMIASLSARIIAVQPSTVFLLEALPLPLRDLFATGLAHPVLAGVAVGGLSLILLVSWMILLILTARTESAFSASQGLMLVIWPCWPAFGGMLLALTAATAPPFSSDLLGLLLLIGGITTLATVTIRVLLDYQAVLAVSPIQAFILFLPSPLLLIAGATVGIVVLYDVPLALLWQLAAHT